MVKKILLYLFIAANIQYNAFSQVSYEQLGEEIDLAINAVMQKKNEELIAHIQNWQNKLKDPEFRNYLVKNADMMISDLKGVSWQFASIAVEYLDRWRFAYCNICVELSLNQPKTFQDFFNTCKPLKQVMDQWCEEAEELLTRPRSTVAISYIYPFFDINRKTAEGIISSFPEKFIDLPIERISNRTTIAAC